MLSSDQICTVLSYFDQRQRADFSRPFVLFRFLSGMSGNFPAKGLKYPSCLLLELKSLETATVPHNSAPIPSTGSEKTSFMYDRPRRDNSSAHAECRAEVKTWRKFACHVCTDLLVSLGALIQ